MKFFFANSTSLKTALTGTKFLLSFCFLSFFSFIHNASAQLMSVKENTSQQISFKENTKSDWTVYCDHENRVIYIDFEKINTNLSAVLVKDNQGKVIFKDDNLWQLPVNSIYEIDCVHYEKGDYTIELKSFTSSIKKGFEVR